MTPGAVYRVGEALFVITVAPAPERSVAELWRVTGDGLLRVLDPDGTPFQASAASPWQAQHRAVSRLESFLRERAHEQRGATLPLTPLDATWQLPG